MPKRKFRKKTGKVIRQNRPDHSKEKIYYGEKFYKKKKKLKKWKK